MDTPAEFYTARAVMPPSYLAAKASLRVAARHFTPETYFAATTALERAVVEFERETDTHPLPVAAQTYGRIADDQELARLVRAVERARRKWLAAN